VLAMNEAYFKVLEAEQKIAISFRFVQEVDTKRIDRVFNFSRDLNENVDVGLNRIRGNLEKEFVKKTKKKSKKAAVEGEQEQENVQVRLKRRKLERSLGESCEIRGKSIKIFNWSLL
jgi:hypothetical protein